MLSLDYENENGDGDTYSMLDSVTDTSPNVEKIAEDKLLLAALFKRLCELDPDGEIIWQMLAEESSDRAIAKKLDRPLVWFGLTWSLELYQQTNARLWRQGQTAETVVIQHIIAKGTIDEKILKALKNKDRTQSALIDAVKAEVK